MIVRLFLLLTVLPVSAFAQQGDEGIKTELSNRVYAGPWSSKESMSAWETILAELQ